MYMQTTGQEHTYLELQHRAETNADEEYDDIVGVAVTSVGVQTINPEQTTYRENNGGGLAKVKNVSQDDKLIGGDGLAIAALLGRVPVTYQLQI